MDKALSRNPVKKCALSICTSVKTSYMAEFAAVSERESLAAPGAFAGTAAVRCDVAAPTITGAKLLRNGLEHVSFTG